MARRTVTAIILLAIAVPAILLGGIFFFLFISFFVVVAAWEYVQMFRRVQVEASMPVVLGGVTLILAARGLQPAAAEPVFTCLVLLAMAVHIWAYERGREQAALDFAATAAGLVYLGWLGSYLIDLRALPDGGWWVMLVLPVVWIADSGAYMIGAKYGKHKLSPRLSPKKSWEGYWAGVFAGTLYGGFFAYAYSRFGPLHISVLQGVLLGLFLSLVTTLGDLGESLFKRQAGAKDSGSLFPGHGGAFDRIDSLIWAAVIGVYWIRWFLL
jgi:phosphatidate cytidylyltransferase